MMLEAQGYRVAFACISVTLMFAPSCAIDDDSGAGLTVACIRQAAAEGDSSVTCEVSKSAFSIVLLPRSIDEASLTRLGTTAREREIIMASRPESFDSALAVFDVSGASIAWYLGAYVRVEKPMRLQRDFAGSIMVEIESGYPLPSIINVE